MVDHRRRNLSEEGKALNVERLKAYKAKLIVFPRKASKPKKGDSTVRPLSFFVSLLLLKSAKGDDLNAPTTRINLGLPSPFVPEAPRKITEEEHNFEAAKTLRDAKFRARHEGQRKLRAAKVMDLMTVHLIVFANDFSLVAGGGGG